MKKNPKPKKPQKPAHKQKSKTKAESYCMISMCCKYRKKHLVHCFLYSAHLQEYVNINNASWGKNQTVN